MSFSTIPIRQNDQLITAAWFNSIRTALVASTSGAVIDNYIDDAAFVTAKGSAAESGDFYYNSTSDLLKVYNGVAWVEVLDASTSQVIINKTISGLSNTITNLTHGTQVNNPTSGVHGATGNIVGTSDAQVLTNKDIDGGTASDTLRITLPKNTTANLAGLTNKEATVAYDTDLDKVVYNSGSAWLEVGGSTPQVASLFLNGSFSVTMGSSAVTIALKQKDGTTDPSTGTSSVSIGFRNATATSGAFSIVDVTGALSVVIPSGATLGQFSAVSQRTFIYAINNAGTVELAVSSTLYDEVAVKTTTAIDTASDSFGGIYSTTARSNVAIRLIGYFDSTQATAGTWDTAASNLFAGPVYPAPKELLPNISFIGYAGSDQAIASGSYVTMTTITPSKDTTGSWSDSTDTYTVPMDGEYEIKMRMNLANNASGLRFYNFQIASQDYPVCVDSNPSSGNQSQTSGSRTIALVRGDQITFTIYQNSGSTLTHTASAVATQFSIRRVGD